MGPEFFIHLEHPMIQKKRACIVTSTSKRVLHLCCVLSCTVSPVDLKNPKHGLHIPILYILPQPHPSHAAHSLTARSLDPFRGILHQVMAPNRIDLFPAKHWMIMKKLMVLLSFHILYTALHLFIQGLHLTGLT